MKSDGSAEQREEELSYIASFGQGVTDVDVATLDWLYAERRRLLVCLGYEACELTEKQAADLLAVDRLDFRAIRRAALAAVAELIEEYVSREKKEGETGVTEGIPQNDSDCCTPACCQ